MATGDREAFELFISQSFPESVTRQELRLSAQEVEWLKLRYPEAKFEVFSVTQYADGKLWYEVQL